MLLWTTPSLKRALGIWLSAPPHPATIALGRWLLRPLARAFTTWRVGNSTIKAEASVQRGAVALARWLHRRTGRAFLRWDETRQAHEVARRAVAHLWHHDVAAGLARWHEHVRMLGVVGRAVACMRTTGLRHGLSSWQAYVEQTERAFALIDRGVRGMRLSWLRKAYK